MSRIKTIAVKELKDYFSSPVAYIVIPLFLVVTGWFFFSTFFIYDRASMRDFFLLLPMVFAFIIPAVTMRLFAEEMNIGSYETLLTMPVSFSDIALGKFAAAVLFTAAMLLPTLFYPVCISFLGELDPGPVIGGYTGALLLGGAYCAIGLFASSLTRSQIIAFITGAAICFTLTVADRLLILLPSNLASAVDFISANSHFENVAKGVIDSRDIVYFLSIMVIAIFGTYLVMKEKD
ncbi:MAG: ABC transporter [Desulfobacteraceae bacterium]